MNNTLYNIFAVIGMLNCTAILVVLLVVLYCWIGDMVFYYCGRVNNYKIIEYEPMEHPPSVDMAFGSKPYLVDAEFHGGRYK